MARATVKTSSSLIIGEMGNESTSSANCSVSGNDKS